MNFKKTFKKYLLLILIPLLMITLTSCYDDFGMSASDYDVVLTFFDGDAKFGEYKSYAILDSVFHITEDGEDSGLLSREYDEDILIRIESNMDALGFQKESDPENNVPDVVVIVAATATRNFNIWTWFPVVPGWGWWGGWHYPWTTVTSFDSGTLIFSLVDTEDFDPEEARYNGIWIAGVNGVMQRTASDLPRINSHIDQAFKQSQYLAPNQ